MRCKTLGFSLCLVSMLGTAEASGKSVDPDAVQRAICDTRSPCVVKEMKDAGRTRAGALSVAKVALHDAPVSSQESPQEKPFRCLDYEYWLVIQKKDGEISTRPLLEVCDYSDDPWGRGGDSVEVSDNLFTHRTWGSALWHWSTTWILQLDPLLIIYKTEGGTQKVDGAWVTDTWRFTDWTGFSASSAKACKGTKEITYAYQPIPRVALDRKFRKTEWRTTSLGGCSTRIDSRGGASEKTPGGGFVVHGTPGDPSDATLRVLLSSENELFVEVQDDVFVPTATSWLHADHLELWLGKRDREGSHCISSAGRLFQWGIDLQGKVYKAFGKPSFAPVVERAEQQLAGGKKIMRFKLALPQEIVSSIEDGFEITVAYSDSDDGEQQERIIATSKITFGSLPTLGDVRDIRPEVGACHSEAGELRTVDTRVYDESRPVLGLE